MTLDDVRLKDISELDDSDKKILNDSWGKLTSEEQDYFGTVHQQDNEDGGFKLGFKTQEEFDAYVEKKANEVIETRRQEEEEEAKRKTIPADEKLFPDGYKAKDWNEAFSTALPKIEDRIVKKIQSMTAEQRKKYDEIQKEFDQEFKSIAAKDRDVPREGTKEREDWEAEVSAVGQKYKLLKMTDAYDVWKALNTSKPAQQAEPADIRVEGNRDLAKKVGRGYGSGTSPTKTSYRVGGGMRLDEILEKRKAEEGIAD